MNDDSPKLEAWNYDDAHKIADPTQMRQQSVSWSAVGEGMAKDQTEHAALRRSFTATTLILILILGKFVRILGFIATLVVMVPIIRATLHGNRRPSRTFEVIFWVAIAIAMCAIIVVF
jgi:hypothetical protein